MNPPLRDDQRLVVLDTLEELRAEPPSRNLAGPGCVMALPGFVILLVFPMVGRTLGVDGAVATAVLLGGGILLVVGLGLWFMAGGLVRGRSIAAAEAALRTLEKGEEEPDVLLRAATLLLYHAYATYGPSTVHTFDADQARGRLGDRLPLVLAVEDLLLAEQAVYPVFTAREADEGA